MPKTLLLADDSVTIQKVVGISFANEDIVLLTVDNGDDAIARAREARPDVILADVVMPGKNGYDVCQVIKADPSLAHIPVLLLTGTFEAFDEQRAARVGADGHITKPFEAQSLVDTVNGLLARPPGGAGDSESRAGAARSGGAPIGTLRPARVAAPAPQPVSHTADTAYDFFDEEITAPRSGSDAPREDTTVLISQPSPAAAAPAEDGFGFDDPAPAREAALPPRAPDRGPLGAEPGFGAEELEVGGAGAEEEASLFDAFEPAPPASAPREEAPAAAFEWSAPAEEPATSGPLAWEVRSEAAPSGDIGWEGQGDTDPEPMAWEAERAPAAAARPAAAAQDEADWFSPAPDPQASTRLMEPMLESGDPLGAVAPAAEERGFGEFALDAGLEGGGFGEAVLDPRSAHDYDVSSSDLGAPLAAASPVSGAPPVATAALAAVPAAERKELHDALEKLAWEAFGPVAESLVREAVERIERIAWEVIPQLAEAVIREEIRKLKGD